MQYIVIKAHARSTVIDDITYGPFKNTQDAQAFADQMYKTLPYEDRQAWGFVVRQCWQVKVINHPIFEVITE